MPRTLAQNATYINETIKPAIKAAIEAQGVTVPSTDSFLDYADRIGEIEGGGSGYQLKDLPTGSISTVNDAAELPLNALKVSVEAWQEGSGDPSPSNIRPIHGWNSGEINIVGKNYAYNNMAADVDLNGVKWEKQTDGSIKVSGTATANSYIINAVRADIGNYKGSIILSGLSDVENITVDTISLYDKDNSLIITLIGGTADKVIDLTQYDGVRYLSITYKRITNSTVSGVIKPQIEIGTQATAYEPYQHKPYQHDFTDSQGNPLECLGGEWNVTDGDLDHNGYVFNLNDYNFMYNATTKTFYRSTTSPLPEAKRVNGDAIANAICDCFKCVSNDELKSDLTLDACFSIHYEAANSWINIRDLRFTAPADFRSAMTGQKIIYELATPQAIPQQPLTPRLLEGTNNIYADCGEVIEGEYFIGSAKGYVDGIKYAGEGDGGIASYTNVKSADELLGASAITFEVYARIDSYVSKTSGAYARLMEFGNSQQTGRLGFVGLASDNDNNLCYWDDTADIASGIDTWTLGDTHLVSIVKTTAGALKIYVDGVLKYTGSSTLSITTSIIDYVTERGGYSSQVDSARQLNGEVFAWRVYAKELSAANIAQNLTADRSLYSR